MKLKELWDNILTYFCIVVLIGIVGLAGYYGLAPRPIYTFIEDKSVVKILKVERLQRYASYYIVEDTDGVKTSVYLSSLGSDLKVGNTVEVDRRKYINVKTNKEDMRQYKLPSVNEWRTASGTKVRINQIK